LSIVLSTQFNIANVINKFLNFVKAKLDELFIAMLQQQQRVILLSNKIENFNNKQDLSILFIILFFSNFENTTSLELFFNFKDSIFSNFIDFNKSFEVTKLSNTLQNLLSQNLDLTLQRYSKLRLQ